jgi:hypothetical protein
MNDSKRKRMRHLGGVGTLAALLAVSFVCHAGAPAGRFTASSGTVHDTKTGLTWQQAVPAGTYTWGSASTSGTAQNYCASLTLNAVSWRLPTMKELTTIVDYSVASPGPAIDTTAFPSTPTGGFWSSTPQAASSNAWAVYFNGANGAPISNTSAALSVRCVR